MKWEKPSKIQAVSYPYITKEPFRNFIGQSKNGSGKTGAFLLGMLNRIDPNDKNLQGVVFSHSREMVNQTASVLSQMCLNTGIKTLNFLNTNKNVELGHIIVTTPGNFEKQLLNNPKKKDLLSKLRVFVVDEIDEILKYDNSFKNFEDTCKYFIENKINIQFILFTATLTEDNLKILKKYIPKAVIIQAAPESLTLKNVKQFYYLADDKREKIEFIEKYLSNSMDSERVIIFVNSKKGTVELQETLKKKGFKVYIIMGGDMDPLERDNTLKKFRAGEIQILITTNLLAKGFDEKLVKLIINYDLPVLFPNYEPDVTTYLHRVGRTGRFGDFGIGLTLLDNKRNEEEKIKLVEKHYTCNVEQIKSIDELISYFKKIISNKI